MIRERLFASGFLLLALLLSGCGALAPVIVPAQPDAPAWLPMAPGEKAGQTLTSRSAGLNGVSLYLELPQPAAGELVLRLLQAPGDQVELAQAVIPASQIGAADYYRFSFADQPASRQMDYYIELENRSDGVLQVGFAGGDHYLDGAAYWAGQPQDAQLAFQLVYGAGWWLSLARNMINWLLALAVFSLLFVIPGWVVLHGLWDGWKTLRWAVKIPLASGVGLGLYPLWLSWSYLLHWQNGLWFSRLLPALALLVLLWQSRSSLLAFFVNRDPFPTRLRGWLVQAFLPSDIALLCLLGALAYTRFIPLSEIDIPLFGDSVQHVMITQLLIDHGGLFSSWQPYAEIGTFTYHFGFHAATAAFHWLSGISVVRSVLWVSQILNILAVWGMYPLAVQALGGIGNSLPGGKERQVPALGGLVAVAVAGLAVSVPQIYLNWGRDTQLAGQVVLIPLMVLAWRLLEAEKPDWRLLVAAALAMSGLVLSHYRVAVFGVLFVGLAWLAALRPGRWLLQTGRLAGLGGLSLVFTIAWLGGLFTGRVLRLFTRLASVPASQASDFNLQANQLGDLTQYAPVWLWLLAFLALGWALWRREKGLSLLAGWSGLVLLAANPHWLSLPGVGLLSTFAVVIACYVPLSVILGSAAAWLIEGLMDRLPRFRPALSWLLPLVLVGCAAWLWGQPRIEDIEVKTYAMVGRPDLRAMGWLQANTPPDSLIAVNAFLAFNNYVVAGADGGWWLPLLAQRATILPPITYGFENGESTDFNQKTNTLVVDLLRLGATSQEGVQLLLQNGVDYVYIGQRQGRVNNPVPVFDPLAMLGSGYYQPVYHQDRVWIFTIVPP